MLQKAEKRYKNTLDTNRKMYHADMLKKIKQLKTSDPKEYWKLLNKGRERKQPNIPLECHVLVLCCIWLLVVSPVLCNSPMLKI